MKFPQLPVGETFIWKSERFRKTGPVAATHLETGAQRMVPRSAEVEPDSTPPETRLAEPVNETTLGLAGITLALEEYQSRLRKEIQAHCPGLAPDSRDRMLQAAAAEFWSALKILSK